MSIGEQGSSFRQSIDVGSLHLRMSIQTSDPVIQIVDGDEEHIRLGAPTADRTREEASDGNEYRFHKVFL